MAITAARLRPGAVAVGSWVRRSPYFRKWLVLGAAIGAIAGLGAVVFYSALALATHVFLGVIAGYQPPTPAGEGLALGSRHFARPWAIPLVVAGGGLLAGLLVFSVAPEAQGHGTDAAIDAVHKNPRAIRMRTVAVKIVASALTIGSGGSGGREGPTAQISAGFGSLLARVLDLSPEDGRIAVSIGIGSGIGAIFGAPLGGAVLAADIIYRDDFEVAALVPGLIASIIAYSVFGFAETFTPLFGYAAAGYQFHDPLQLVWFAIIGVLGGATGLLYAKSFYAMVGLTRRLPGSRALKPAVGGLLVGLIALAIPQVLSTGYGWVQEALGPSLLSIPLWIVLLLPFARIGATALSIGSGGSGGIFGPGMVVGAFLGAAVWRLLRGAVPAVPHDAAPFVVVGMMACFGGISRAPLAVMLMVAEMTGSLELLAPAMVAVGLSYLIVRNGDDTIYRAQLKSRAESPAQRLAFGLPLAASLVAERAMQAPRLVLDGSTRVEDALARLQEHALPGAPVVDDRQRFVGAVTTAALEAVVDRAGREPVLRRADSAAPTLLPTTGLDVAIDAVTTGGGWATVVDDQRRVRGVIATSDIVRGYAGALRSNVGRLAQLAVAVAPLEARVGQSSALAGRPLRARLLPPGCIVISIQRGNDLRFPTAEEVLQPGDTVTALAPKGADASLRAAIQGPLGPAGAGPKDDRPPGEGSERRAHVRRRRRTGEPEPGDAHRDASAPAPERLSRGDPSA